MRGGSACDGASRFCDQQPTSFTDGARAALSSSRPFHAFYLAMGCFNVRRFEGDCDLSLMAVKGRDPSIKLCIDVLFPQRARHDVRAFIQRVGAARPGAPTALPTFPATSQIPRIETTIGSAFIVDLGPVPVLLWLSTAHARMPEDGVSNGSPPLPFFLTLFCSTRIC